MTTLSTYILMTCLMHEYNEKGVRGPEQEKFENSYLLSSVFDPFS